MEQADWAIKESRYNAVWTWVQGSVDRTLLQGELEALHRPTQAKSTLEVTIGGRRVGAVTWRTTVWPEDWPKLT